MASAQVDWAVHADECYTDSDVERALTSCTRALASIAVPGPMRAELYIQRAHHRLARKDPAKAVADFTAALSYDTHYPAAFFGRGMALIQTGDDERAIADFDRAIELQPSAPYNFLHRAAAWEQRGATERALRDYDAALALNADLAPAQDGRARMLRALGQVDRAVDQFNETLRRSPEIARA
ncbi:MAG: tetratricopeptide repeat protein [Alphaproteobacteria bacterium]|nr:tetratricopeptide repeat protein [Alphaproteobacteria bacterium]